MRAACTHTHLYITLCSLKGEGTSEAGCPFLAPCSPPSLPLLPLLLLPPLPLLLLLLLPFKEPSKPANPLKRRGTPSLLLFTAARAPPSLPILVSAPPPPLPPPPLTPPLPPTPPRPSLSLLLLLPSSRVLLGDGGLLRCARLPALLASPA